MHFVAEELSSIMAQLGFRTVDEMVGQSQKLNMSDAIDHYKAKGIDLSSILHKPNVEKGTPERNVEKQDHKLENVLDFTLISEASKAIEKLEPQTLAFPIHNTDRSVGAILSNEISKNMGLMVFLKTPWPYILRVLQAKFGCFATKGLHLETIGNCNDYFGKGLSGARLIARIPYDVSYKADENIIVGNVALYGATAGEA